MAPVAESTPSSRKELGAFYTPEAIARILVEWAVRNANDAVLDPSFGGLVFLQATQKRFVALGAQEGRIGARIYGVELDEDAHSKARSGSGLGIPRPNLLHNDFFSVSPTHDLPRVEAVVGNPPYVRYQDFNGRAEVAHRLAAAAGAKLTRLASSWAPFVIHAVDFVKPGGRLALVLPAEILHAQYAKEVAGFLCDEFASVTLAVFEERVFPGALEEVVLLFADGRGAAKATGIRLVESRSLDEFDMGSLQAPAGGQVSGASSEPTSRQLLAQLLPPATQSLYERLAEDERVRRLGTMASVDIGAVTGANEFFLLRRQEAGKLPAELLVPTVSKARHVSGARLSKDHLADLSDSGEPTLMFVADDDSPPELIDEATSYLRRGRRAKVHRRYKCRIRDPWWAVPVPKRGPPDLLLTYCSSRHPRVVANEAGVLHTNTLHAVTLEDPAVTAQLAVGFYNSLTLLSAEVVGRSYGGGVLKLEPTEAEALLVPPIDEKLAQELDQVDAWLRAGELDSALDLVDRVTLGSGLGLTEGEISVLRAGAEQLRTRRRTRGTAARS